MAKRKAATSKTRYRDTSLAIEFRTPEASVSFRDASGLSYDKESAATVRLSVFSEPAGKNIVSRHLNVSASVDGCSFESVLLELSAGDCIVLSDALRLAADAMTT